MLAEILSSKIRAEIFRLLFGAAGEELHMREIQRRSACAIGTIQAELTRLRYLGLVLDRKDGNRLYFRANQDHLLYQDIHSLVVKSNGLADTLRQALEREKGVESAFIIGAAGTRQTKADSEIDLLVIGDLKRRHLADLLPEVAGLLPKRIFLHAMSRQEFISRRRKKDHFINQLLEAPRTCLIGSENCLLEISIE